MMMTPNAVAAALTLDDVRSATDVDSQISEHLRPALDKLLLAYSRSIINKVLADVKVDVVVDDDGPYIEMFHEPSGEMLFRAKFSTMLDVAITSVTSSRTGRIHSTAIPPFTGLREQVAAALATEFLPPAAVKRRATKKTPSPEARP